MIVALLVALGPATSSPHAPTAREAQMREANLRAAAARGLIKTATKPAARKGKAVTMPGKVGPHTKSKAKNKRMKPPARLGKRKPMTSAPCSTVEAPVHDGAVRPGIEGLVADKYWVWPNASKLHVHFLDGSPEARAAVAKIAAEWSEFANIDFVFHLEDSPPPQVDIAVTFDDAACNSSMGPGSRDTAAWGGASMRLCHIDQMMGSEFFRRATLHEFGHALGMHHEHQSPKAAYSWNKPAVYAYYAQIGWSESFVDQWVFSKVNENEVRASDWDPNSVMHYEFPASFTTDNTEIHGGSVLSDLDKQFIAQIYPGRGKKPPVDPKAKPRPVPKLEHYAQRRVMLRNDTDTTLVMDIAVERKSGDKWKWVPSASPETKGARFTLAPGTQKLLPTAMVGRAARVRAQSSDGTKVWSDHLDSTVLVDSAGYDDRAMQSFVIATSGQPDAPASIGRDALWDLAQAELDAGKWTKAREGFEDFAARFPDDPWTPWAKLYVVTALIGQRQHTEAAFAAYALILDHPDADASRYAWFYGGVAAMERGACGDAAAYFDVASQSGSGLPSDWIDSAKDYLRQIDQQRDTWCA